MSKRIVYIKTNAYQANYQLPEYKRLESVHIYTLGTNMWQVIFNSHVRSDMPTYSVRGNELILDPVPTEEYIVKMKLYV